MSQQENLSQEETPQEESQPETLDSILAEYEPPVEETPAVGGNISQIG